MENILFESKKLEVPKIAKYDDFIIIDNDVTFIVGESGSGKSTLLSLFNSTGLPYTGLLSYLGTDILTYDRIPLRKEISLVSQDAYLFDKSIMENFFEFYKYRNQPIPNESEIRQLLLEMFLNFPLNKDVSSMSGGERHRLYICIFLSFMPKVLLLDEPTAALDENTGTEIITNIINYCKNHNIKLITVSHDKSIVKAFADQIIEVNK